MRTGEAHGLDLKSSQFRKERERSWRELERILDAVEQRGFPSCPRRTCTGSRCFTGARSARSRSRGAISLDRNLLEYLEALVSRAYLCLYSNKRFTGEVVVEFSPAGSPAQSACSGSPPRCLRDSWRWGSSAGSC
jgi:hypothetical protein